MYSVVVVEDSLIMHEIYRMALYGSDFEIIGVAMDGKKALDILRYVMPDILILDLVLPEMNGVDVLKKLPEISPNTQTVVITSVEDQKVLQQVRSFGAVFILQKPFKKEQLINTLSALAEQTKGVKHG